MSSNLKVSVSKRKLLLAFISIALICSLSSGSIMYVVAQGGSTPLTISSGIYPGAPSHTLYVNGATYYDKTNYGVVTSSTNAATIIQAALTSVAGTGNKIYLTSGQYNIGTTSITGVSNSVLEFEGIKSPNGDQGAIIVYTGTGIALDYYNAVRGDIRDFQIINPNIKAITGTGLRISGGYCFTVQNPNICAKNGIDIENSNTGKIINGGFIIGTAGGTVGTFGVRLGCGAAETLLIEINVHQVSGFDSGLLIGDESAGAALMIDVHNTDFSTNNWGVSLLYSHNF
jgi:hypothetical protein